MACQSWRRKLLVGAIVATALALGIIAVFVSTPLAENWRPHPRAGRGFEVS